MGAVNALMPLLVCDIPKIQQPALLCYSAMSFQNGAVSLAMKSGMFYFSWKMIIWIVVPLEFWTVWNHHGKMVCFYLGSNDFIKYKVQQKIIQLSPCKTENYASIFFVVISTKSYRITVKPWSHEILVLIIRRFFNIFKGFHERKWLSWVFVSLSQNQT